MPPEVFLQNILEEILDKPEDIKIIKWIDEFWVLLSIIVNKKDLPLLIGKKGDTINSLRNIIRTFWFKRKLRINLKIVEN